MATITIELTWLLASLLCIPHLLLSTSDGWKEETDERKWHEDGGVAPADHFLNRFIPLNRLSIGYTCGSSLEAQVLRAVFWSDINQRKEMIWWAVRRNSPALNRLCKWGLEQLHLTFTFACCSTLEWPKSTVKAFCDTLVILSRQSVANYTCTVNLFTIRSCCSLVKDSQSVTLHPNYRNDRPNVTFKTLYFANNLTANWAEAYSIRQRELCCNILRKKLQYQGQRVEINITTIKLWFCCGKS